MNSDNPLPPHDRKPSILGCMILTRMIANSKTPSLSEIRKDLRPMFAASVEGSDAVWNELVARTMTELFELNCVTHPMKKIAITDRGQAVLREFLKTEQLPERKKWATIKKLILTPLAFGERPENSKDLDRIGKAEGFQAELLRHLFKLRLNPFPSLPLAISAVAAQHGLHAKKPNGESLREAFLQSWIAEAGHQIVAARTGPQLSDAPTATGADSLAAFASRIQQLARTLPGSRENGKVLISKIWHLLKTGEGGQPMTRERFDEQLLQSNQAQLLSLGRADLSAGLDPQDIRDSELSPEFGDKFHFVRTDRDSANSSGQERF